MQKKGEQTEVTSGKNPSSNSQPYCGCTSGLDNRRIQGQFLHSCRQDPSVHSLYRSSDAGTNIEISFPYQVLQPSGAVKLSPVLYCRPPLVQVPVGGVAVAVVVVVGGMV